jgi:hypothetical protein
VRCLVRFSIPLRLASVVGVRSHFACAGRDFCRQTVTSSLS